MGPLRCDWNAERSVNFAGLGPAAAGRTRQPSKPSALREAAEYFRGRADIMALCSSIVGQFKSWLENGRRGSEVAKVQKIKPMFWLFSDFQKIVNGFDMHK